MNEPATKKSVLVVDDDAAFRVRLVKAFEARGFDARGADGHDEAVARATEESPELAVVDLRMPGKSGIDVVKSLHALDATTAIVVLTGYGSIATALEAVRMGAVNYLTKPAAVDEILRAFEPGSGPPPDDHAVPSLARAEWEHIQRILTDCDGNISAAARLLGIHRRSLQRKLSKYPTSR